MCAKRESPPLAHVAAAIGQELGGSHQAIKTLRRRTGASERTAKNWMSGTVGPSGAHLIELMRTSDVICEVVLILAGRRPHGSHLERSILFLRRVLAIVVVITVRYELAKWPAPCGGDRFDKPLVGLFRVVVLFPALAVNLAGDRREPDCLRHHHLSRRVAACPGRQSRMIAARYRMDFP